MTTRKRTKKTMTSSLKCPSLSDMRGVLVAAIAVGTVVGIISENILTGVGIALAAVTICFLEWLYQKNGMKR